METIMPYSLLSTIITAEKQGFRRLSVVHPLPSPSAPMIASTTDLSYFTSPINIPPGAAVTNPIRRPPPRTYKSHFRERYILEKNWRIGGTLMARYITNDHGVVTTLCMSDKYIIVGLDNSNIRVFDEDGRFLITLAGHETGVWAMVVVGDDHLVSGGCDRDMRLWDLTTGYYPLFITLISVNVNKSFEDIHLLFDVFNQLDTKQLYQDQGIRHSVFGI
jgi:WD40 repeat protein